MKMIESFLGEIKQDDEYYSVTNIDGRIIVEGATFENEDFSCVNTTNVSFNFCEFKNCKWKNLSDVNRVSFYCCTFEKTTFYDVYWLGVSFYQCFFVETLISNTTFMYGKMCRSTFEDCKMYHNGFIGSDLGQCGFIGDNSEYRSVFFNQCNFGLAYCYVDLSECEFKLLNSDINQNMSSFELLDNIKGLLQDAKMNVDFNKHPNDKNVSTLKKLIKIIDSL